MDNIIIVTGQTATGKTKYAVELAKKHNGELINCDSRQIYKKLDIVTGKDISKIPVKIWLYDIIDPKVYFSSFDWVQMARKTIADIQKRGYTPIVVGGTWLYIKHLLYGFQTASIPPDWDLRKKLNNKSVTELQKIFQQINNKAFKQLNNSDKNNPQRLIRKIEIANKKKVSAHFNQFQLVSTSFNQFQPTIIGLRSRDQKSLRQKITVRVKERIGDGAITEVRSLLQQGYKADDPGLKTIGYQQLIKYLQGKITKEQAIEEWVNKELQYAKRQLTFMKKDKNILWYSI